MKRITFCVLLSVFCTGSFCTNSQFKAKDLSQDSLFAIQMKNEKDLLEKRKAVDDYWLKDTIRMRDALRGAMDSIAVKRMGERDSARYDIELDSVLVGVEIGSRNYFKGPFRYRIIRLSSPASVRIHIYAKSGDTWDQILSHNQWGLEYVNDTIMDVNVDGRKDFVVNWYGVNGCCLKGFSKVYLLRDDMKSFSNHLQFINPSFSPKEHVIRGVKYGHPGETSMYKYRWEGERVDTIEYVRYQTDKDGKKTGRVELRDADNRVIKVLPSVPKEYRKIYGYDWFTGNF